MADGGQKFLKICMSIFESSSMDIDSDNDDEILNSTKKRKTYAEGGSLDGEIKMTSVRKLILLCIVPDVKETYDNF